MKVAPLLCPAPAGAREGGDRDVPPPAPEPAGHVGRGGATQVLETVGGGDRGAL